MRALLLVVLLLPLAAAQEPGQIAVTLAATPADAEWSPPEVSHLAIQWTPIEPYVAGVHQPEIRWELRGESHATPAQVIGAVRDQTIGEFEAQLSYGARIPVTYGDQITYTVGDALAGFSDAKTVNMLPPPIDDVRLAFMSRIGYAGYDRETRERIADEPSPPEDIVNITLGLEPDVVLIPGNVAMSTSIRPWDITRTILEPLISTVPLVAVPGETDADLDYQNFRQRFIWPGQDNGIVNGLSTGTPADESARSDDEELLYHGFSVGSAYIIGLDAPGICKPLVASAVTLPPCPAGQGMLDPDQIQWFHDALEDAREDLNPSWIIVYLSDGPYVHADDGGNTLVQQYYQPLWEMFGVDLVIHGQEAIYQRSYPSWAGLPASAALTDYQRGTGPIYVNTGGGGGSLTEAMDHAWPPWLAVSQSVHHVTTVDVSESRLSVRAIDVNGQPIDAFTLHAPESQGYADAAGRIGSDEQRAATAPLVFLIIGIMLASRRFTSRTKTISTRD